MHLTFADNPFFEFHCVQRAIKTYVACFKEPLACSIISIFILRTIRMPTSFSYSKRARVWNASFPRCFSSLLFLSWLWIRSYNVTVSPLQTEVMLLFFKMFDIIWKHAPRLLIRRGDILLGYKTATKISSAFFSELFLSTMNISIDRLVLTSMWSEMLYWERREV